MLSVFIDGLDIEAAFGICLEDGGLEVFEVPPKPREPFYNEWADQSGRDYDTDVPQVYESQTFDVPFLIIGESMADYREKKRDFMQLIDRNAEFDLQVVDWGEAWRLRYKQVVSWSLINIGLGTRTSGRFVIRLENNHGVPIYAFKYLADNLGRYIVINGGQKILVKTSL